MTWQPIDTAPKDAGEILTLSSAGGVDIVRNCFWGDEDNAWFYMTSTCGSTTFDPWFAPTHWMPLPEPPE